MSLHRVVDPTRHPDYVAPPRWVDQDDAHLAIENTLGKLPYAWFTDYLSGLQYEDQAAPLAAIWSASEELRKRVTELRLVKPWVGAFDVLTDEQERDVIDCATADLALADDAMRELLDKVHGEKIDREMERICNDYV